MHRSMPATSIEPERLELVWPSDLSCMQQHRSAVAQFLAERVYSQNLAQDLTLVIDEAMSNVVRHSYAGEKGHTGHLVISLEETCGGRLCHLTVVITDQGIHGRHFNPAERYDTARQEAGKTVGYGMVLLHRLMDEVAYEVTPEGDNRLTLERWFCNAPTDLGYVRELIAELQGQKILPPINHTTVEELVEANANLEPGEVIEVIAAIKRLEPSGLRRAITRARLLLAERVSLPDTGS